MKNDYKKNFKEAVAKLDKDDVDLFFEKLVNNLQQSELYLKKARNFFRVKNPITEDLINKLDSIDDELLYMISVLSKKYD